METKDKKQFSRTFKKLAILMDKQADQNLIQIYFDALSAYSMDDVEGGINQAIKTCRFFPKPVEIIEGMDLQEKYI